jgi:hypothetical protein
MNLKITIFPFFSLKFIKIIILFQIFKMTFIIKKANNLKNSFF